MKRDVMDEAILEDILAPGGKAREVKNRKLAKLLKNLDSRRQTLAEKTQALKDYLDSKEGKVPPEHE